VVECQLPKLDVTGSNPVARSKISLFRIRCLRGFAGLNSSARKAAFSRFLAYFWQTWPEFGGKMLGQATDSFRFSHPSTVMPDDHFERRVTHLVSHVLRVLTARELQRGVRVPALIERPGAQPGLAQQSSPIPLAQVC
jgi:hypothetical protein